MSKWLNSFRQKRGSLSAVSGLSLETEKNGATNELTELTRGHQSALSVPPEGLFPLDRESLLYDFEERLAISEYDGCQNEIQAKRIAYQDAFISVLNAVPYDQERDLDIKRLLDQRIKAAQEWLAREGVLFHGN